MSLKAIFDFFLIVGVVQGFIFIAISFFLRKKIERTILFLNLFILFLSLNNLNAWFIDKGFLGDRTISKYMNIPWYVMIVPMFYSFLVHYLQIEDRKWPFFKISTVLFLLMLASRFSLVYLVHATKVEAYFLETYSLIEDAMAFSYSIFLYVKSLGLLTKYRKLYPDILVFDDLHWIRQFLKFGGIVFILWFLAMLLNSFFSFIEPPYTYYPLRLLLSILIYWVGYQAFYRYVLIKDRRKIRQKLIDKRGTGFSPVGDNLDKKRKVLYFKKFESYVLANDSYMNADLSLESLAFEMGLSASTLSKSINANRTNFSDYINNLRVQRVKKILKDPSFSNYTIVAIGLECGFNSKSTFYKAFKHFTGITPSDFRNSNI